MIVPVSNYFVATGEGFEKRWLPILMYHRVEEIDAGTDWTVAPAVFEKQLAFFRRQNYQSLTVSQLGEALEGKRRLPARAFTITFDDGYASNYTTAWPLLQKYGYNATIFLVSDYLGGENSFDRNRLRPCPILTAAQVREMQQGGIEFGSHSCTHRSLLTLSDNERAGELSRSRHDLENLLQNPVTTFAYPYSELNEKCEEAVANAGYRWAVAGEGSTFRRYCLNRMNLRSQPWPLISLRISPAFYKLRRSRAYKALRPAKSEI